MIVGPVGTVLGITQELFPKLPGDIEIGSYVVNLWFVIAGGAVLVAQFKLWQDERTEKRAAEARLREDVVLRGPAPTAEEQKARRTAEEKRDRGERLTRRERELLARPDLGVTRSGILDSLGRRLTLGQFDLDSIRQAGEIYQNDWPEFIASRPDKDAVEAWVRRRLNDKALESAHKWKKDVSDLINTYLNYSFVSWFENDSGLVPASPPSSFTEEYFVKAWQQHEMRLQRLQEIIEELHRKWG